MRAEVVMVNTIKVYPKYVGDFFPYADNADSYWTGYFSSRSQLKGSCALVVVLCMFKWECEASAWRSAALLRAADSALALASLVTHVPDQLSSRLSVR
jgi:hypothetical protein